MKRRTIIIVCIIFLIGVGVLLYPTVSNYINTQYQSGRISDYSDKVSIMQENESKKIWSEVDRYNRALRDKTDRFSLSEEEMKEYNSTLNILEDGIIGYIDIDKIDVKLPIYHGMSEEVLQKGVGHLVGSSLPGGGAGTHVILAGHRGLPAAILFSDLDRLEKGDTFVLHVLDRELVYKVDMIKVVQPEDSANLSIQEDKDYVTLVTCTPYSVNSHRLLVRGVRVEHSNDSEEQVASESMEEKMLWLKNNMPVLVAVFASAVFIFVIIKCLKK